MKRFSNGSESLRAALIAVFLLLFSMSPPLAAQDAPETATVAPLPLKGFRFTSRDMPGNVLTAPPDPDVPDDPDDPSQLVPGSGPMQVGKVTDIETLPPAIAEMAREGALEVADGNWEKARAIYLKMIKEAPDSALAYANLGVAEHQLGNLLAAAGNLGKSLDLNPHIARNWQTLGLIHYEKGELALAISHLTRAIHEAPEEAESRLLLAAVVRDYGWTEAAVTELQRAVEIDPKLASAHYNLAVTYLEMKPPRFELARRHYYAAIDLGTAATPEIEAILKQAE